MKEETIKDIGEFECIRRISHDLIYRPEAVKLGAGDDGAVYTVPAGYDQVISIDTMVEWIHFKNETMSASDAGYRICAVNFSDMAAMGAEPVAFVISAAFPDHTPYSWIESCYQGIRECCQKYRVNVLGGDITGSGEGIVLTGTVVGIVPENQAVRRSGAQVNDVVFVTETIGDSAAGLSAILNHQEERFPTILKRHRRPEPQIEAGKILRMAGADSLNDISDGLSREINEIAVASGVIIDIEKEKIPISKEAILLGKELNKNPLNWALNGGEDYELTGTISPAGWEIVKKRLPVTKIGVVRERGSGLVFIKDKGKTELLKSSGYDHFRS